MKDKISLCIYRNPDNSTSSACNRKKNIGSICHLKIALKGIQLITLVFLQWNTDENEYIDFHFLIFL